MSSNSLESICIVVNCSVREDLDMEHVNVQVENWCEKLRASLAYLGEVESNEMIAANLVEIINSFNRGYGPEQTASRIVVQP